MPLQDSKQSRHFPEPKEGSFGVVWNIHSELGRGGVAIVYELTFADDGSPAAGKLFNPDARFTEVDRLRSRFRLEQWLTARFVRFPGLLNCSEFGEWNAQPFIVTRRYNGNLKSKIQSGQRPTTREFLELAFSLLDALTFLHANGVIHRDLKPDNILVSPGYEAYAVADFGIGFLPDSEITRQTATGDLMGSRDYIAPEQRRFPSEATAASDVYSLGIILYEFATGTLPSGAPIPMPELAPSLSWAAPTIERMMSQDPARRPTSCPAAAAALLDAAVQEFFPHGNGAHFAIRRQPFAVLGLLCGIISVPKYHDWSFAHVPDQAYVFDDLLSYVCHSLGEPHKRVVTVGAPSMGNPLPMPGYKSEPYLLISEPPDAIDLLRKEATTLSVKHRRLIDQVGNFTHAHFDSRR